MYAVLIYFIEFYHVGYMLRKILGELLGGSGNYLFI